MKKTHREVGSICFDDVSCLLVSSTPVTFVLVYLFPVKGSNERVKETLKYFGDIKEIKFQQWTNVPGVSTGTRIVGMVLQPEIPRNIVIDGVKFRVWYKGQPLVCDICSNNHKAADCPLHAKSRRCHESGHFVSDCDKPVWYMPGREDHPPSVSSVAPPSGGASASINENVSGTNGESEVVEEVPTSQASQSVLSKRVVTPSVVEDVSASSHAPLERSGGDMDLDSLDSRDNELDEVASQPAVLSGERLFDRGVQIGSGGLLWVPLWCLRKRPQN